MTKLTGKVAIVTGGARGIGAATVRRFAEADARVVIVDLLKEDGLRLEQELGANAKFVEADVSAPAGWDEITRIAKKTFGPVDILVNNAGISGGNTPLTGGDVEQYLHLVAVNQNSVFHGTRAVVPMMQELGGGAIVNVSSVAGIVAWPGLGAYSATKFAVVGFTKTAAAELGSLGIRVNCVHPGIIDTPMVQSTPEDIRKPADEAIAKLPIARLGRPEEIAASILFFASDELSFCTGASLAVDGGWTAI